ncbi:MAG: diguanylate cyclase [Solirubrobacteraceae bacterium]|nr:diguanylate cyclase [Solirubrobacteraceae bacterium]
MWRIAPNLGEELSRHDLVRSPHVWFALWATFGALAISCVGLSFVMPGIDSGRLQVFSAGLVVVTIGLFLSHAPEPNTPTAHLLLALIYVAPAIAIWAFSPSGSAPVASAMFIGPLAAMWSTRRSHQVMHLTAATVALFTPSALGVGDTETLIACIALAPAVWVLSGCVSVILEGIEDQSSRLAHLMRRDPLTGAGNRRLLDEHLAAAAATYRSTGEGFALLTLDLNGFKAINDDLGHAAGDQLLREVGSALLRAAPRGSTVARQGGDEFSVVLPGGTALQASALAVKISAVLDEIRPPGAAGRVSSGVGQAICPHDHTEPEHLLRIADERLREHKHALAAGARRMDLRPTLMASMPTGDAAVEERAPQGDPHAAGAEPSAIFERGIGRLEMQHSKAVWRANAAMYLLYGVVGLGVLQWAPQVVGPAFPYVVAFGALVGVAFLIHGPTRIGTRRNHLGIAMSYVVPATILISCRPGGSVAIGCLIFVGPLVASRLLLRGEIVAHLAVASLALLGLLATGLFEAATMVAILMLVATMWILGACCVIVLEAAEAQTLQLRRLVGSDPLTGVGNRRALDELLNERLDRPGRIVTVLAFDFNGFKALNDTVGHAAGDDLLVSAAHALQDAATEGEHVFRQGGDEFCIVLDAARAPGHTHAPDRIAAFRRALAAVDCGGKPLTTGAGAATAPIDATTAAGLLAAADARLIADKAASSARPRPRSAAAA